jgi:hypothetical protein
MAGGDLRLNIDEINLLNKYGLPFSLDLKPLLLLPRRLLVFSNFAFDKTDKVRVF